MDRPVIGLLDDDYDRIGAMRSQLARRFGDYDVVTFENSPGMILWLRENLERLRLLSLDHDLGPNQVRNGEPFDPGTGRDVADFLATRPPKCHVILHTTNQFAAPGMQSTLEEAGWTVSRVAPYSDLEWIGEVWIREVRSAIEAIG